MRKKILLLILAHSAIPIPSLASSLLTTRGFDRGDCYKHSGFFSCASSIRNSACTLTLFPESNGTLTLNVSKKNPSFISDEIKKGHPVITRFKIEKNKSADATVIKILNINPISKDVFLALRGSENFLAHKVSCK